MLEKLTKKNERGFTLAELLVVVAIIAILVAVSIPIFTSQLEKSREATDQANLRAAKAAATVAALDETMDTAVWNVKENVYTAWYDATNGKLVKTTPGTKYGKGTTAGDVNEANADRYVQATVTIPTSGEPTVEVEWARVE